MALNSQASRTTVALSIVLNIILCLIEYWKWHFTEEWNGNNTVQHMTVNAQRMLVRNEGQPT